MTYDKSKDQSERFGWKKIQDEHVPTEEEQNRWAVISLIIMAVLAGLVLYYGG